MTTPYKLTDKLDPTFKKKVELFISKCPEIFIVESWRSEERQKELIKRGLSKVKRSNHQDGLAIDIAFKGSSLYPSDFSKWRKVADVAKDCGIEWGYDLWAKTGFIDKPHFQNSNLPIKENIMVIPEWAKEIVQEMKEKGITTDPSVEIGKMPLYQLLLMVKKLLK